MEQEKPLLIYSASAGSGKTYTLAKQYIQMLFEERKLTERAHRSILAVTFTKKATAEMKERILKNLFELAHPESYDSDFMDDDDFIAFCHKIDLNTNADIQAEAKQVLKELLQDYSMFSVSTIDSFFQQIVRSFAKEINLHGGYNIELDTKQIIKKAVDDLFFNLRENDAVFPWLVDTLVHNMQERGNWDTKSDILELSDQLAKEDFQNQASKEVLSYTIEQLQDYRQKLWKIFGEYKKDEAALCKAGIKICTNVFGCVESDLKSYFKNGTISYLLKDKGFDDYDMLNAKTFFSIANADNLITSKKPYKEQIYQAWSNGLGQCIFDLQNLYKTRYQQFVSSKFALDNLDALALLPLVSKQIAADNEALHRLPMSDTNQKLSRIIGNSDTPFVYQKIGMQLKHYLLDEFQDTSSMQWTNFLPLIRETLSTSSQHTRDLIVGDVKQSIYRWRNSDWKLLYNGIESDINAEQVTKKSMQSNHRSSKTVVNFNNDFFKKCSETLSVRFASEHQDTEMANILAEIYSDLEQKPEKNIDGRVQIKLFENKDYQENIQSELIKEIKDLQERKVGSIALLIRNNSDASTYASLLAENGIKVTSKEGLQIKKAICVQLIISQLRVFNQPNNQKLQFERNYYYSLLPQTISAEQRLDFLINSQNKINQEINRQMAEIQSEPLYQMIQDIAIALKLTNIEGEQIYMQAFMDEVYNYCKTNDADVYSFLLWWDEFSEKKYVPTSEGENSVQIVTIHKSKGLEFDAVVIPKCDWEFDIDTRKSPTLWCSTGNNKPFDELPMLPIKVAKHIEQSIFAAEYKQETFNYYVDNLNLTYVAFTRPKKELIVFAPKPPANSANIAITHLLDEYCTNGSYTNSNKKDEKEEKKAKRAYKASPLDPLDLSKNQPKFHDMKIRKKYNDSAFIKEGNLVHDILSQIGKESDLTLVLEQFKRTGQLNEQSYKEKAQELQTLFAWVKEQGYDWFTGDYEVKNEIEFIEKNAQWKRADRVMIAEDKVIVVDYKSGTKESSEYEKQVSNYMQALQRIYPKKQIEGYLLFTTQKKIQVCSINSPKNNKK